MSLRAREVVVACIAVLAFSRGALAAAQSDDAVWWHGPAHGVSAREAAARMAPIEKTVADRTLYVHFSKPPAYYVERIDEYYRTQLGGSIAGASAPVSKVLLCLSDVPLVACDDVRFQADLRYNPRAISTATSGMKRKNASCAQRNVRRRS